MQRRSFLLSSLAASACAAARRGEAPSSTPSNDEIAFRGLIEAAEARDESGAAARRMAALRAIDPDALSPEARILYDGVHAGCAAEAALEAAPGDYDAMLQARLGAPISAAAAHDAARANIERLTREADVLLRAEGLAQGAVAERLRAFLSDARYLYSDDDAGRDRAVADMNARLADMRARLPTAFEGLADAPAEVRRMSRDDEARAAPGRREASFYLVDLSHIRARPAWTLPSVVYHETLPGHLLQAKAAESAAPPALQQRFARGYAEAWAIYAEKLAADLGAYDDDPRGRIGFLHWMLFREARILVDTGMHALGWGDARAIAEMRDAQGESIAFISIEADVARIRARPGDYSAQGLAANHLQGLAADAHQRYADAFTLARFHEAVLKRGPLAPPGLERAVALAFAS